MLNGANKYMSFVSNDFFSSLSIIVGKFTKITINILLFSQLTLSTFFYQH